MAFWGCSADVRVNPGSLPQVGRKLEARFQWRRALSFEPTEKDLDRIRRKLEIGLDEVMAEESLAPAIEASENGG